MEEPLLKKCVSSVTLLQRNVFACVTTAVFVLYGSSSLCLWVQLQKMKAKNNRLLLSLLMLRGEKKNQENRVK